MKEASQPWPFPRNSSGLEALKLHPFCSTSRGHGAKLAVVYGFTACAQAPFLQTRVIAMDRWVSCPGRCFTKGIYFWFYHYLSCASNSHELHCFCLLLFPPSLKDCPVPGCCLSPHSQGKGAGADPRASEGLEDLHPFQ